MAIFEKESAVKELVPPSVVSAGNPDWASSLFAVSPWPHIRAVFAAVARKLTFT